MKLEKQSKKSILVKCSRLFKGTIADVRSHIVEKAKQQDKDLRISVKNLGVQTFSADEGMLLVQKKFTSKRGTEPYQLISFFWRKEETKPAHAPARVEVPQAEFSF
jgi:deoxyribodipyrimidine photolyase